MPFRRLAARCRAAVVGASARWRRTSIMLGAVALAVGLAPAQTARAQAADNPPGAASAPSPVIRGDRAVFGAPPSGVAGQRTRSFLPRSNNDVPAAASARAADPVPEEVWREQGGVLHRMPVNLHGFRLRGEIDAMEWPIYLTDSQAHAKVRIAVSYLTAISVMPEASVLNVLVNDAVVGQTNLQAPNGARQVVFEVPGDLLRPGWNSVRLTADMRHRVDCSLGATYELWTQIDSGNTGLLIYGASDSGLVAADIASLSPDAQGAFPIRAVIPGKTSLANVDMVMRAVQSIALRTRYLQPIVDFGPAAGGDGGVNLLVGLYSEISKQPGIEALGSANGPTVALLPATAERRAMLVVTGPTPSELQDALAQFAAMQEPRGTASGLAALAVNRGLRVAGGERISLSKLNVPSTEFSGRLFRQSLDLVMPADFYSADYAKVVLSLDGGYAADLGPEPQISVSVNGRDAATIILPRRNGDVFRQNEIPFPLGHLRPGFNRIEILARVPSRSDASCDPLSAINAKKRFLLLDSSQIVLPRIARIARLPNTGLLASAGFPLTQSPSANLFIPVPDKETTGAAATLAAQLALAAGRPIKFEVTLTPPTNARGSTVVVAPVNGLTPETLTAVGLNPDTVLAAWRQRTDTSGRPAESDLTRFESVARERVSLTRNRPGYCRMRIFGKERATAATPPGGPPRADDSGEPLERAPPRAGDVLDQWNENIHGRTSVFAQVANLFRTVAGWGGDAVRGVGSFVTDEPARPAAAPVTADTSLVLAQGLLASVGDNSLVVVTAPTGPDLSEAMACLVDPAVWRQIGGQASLLDASDGTVLRVPPTAARFVSTQAFSLINTRLIVASWLSHNPSVYVISSLLVAIFLGGTTTWLLRNIGRKQ